PVVVPEPFAAIVRSKAPVRITGTVEKVPIAQIERRGGILTDPKVRVELEMKPALVAEEVHAMVPWTIAVDLLVNPETPVATSGSSQGPITDVSRLPKPTDQSAVGRHVNLMNVGVMAPTDRGFWIMTSNGERIFVMPATKTPVKAGQNANIQAVVLEMPEGLRVELKTSGEPVYIYADRVTTR